ncbi:MAG: ABC transporter permease [Alsobacter sp.]
MSMTAAAPSIRMKTRFDWSMPIFISLAALLVLLVVLPLSWLAFYSVSDGKGGFTLANFVALVTDVTLRRPFAIALGMSVAVGAMSCLIAAPMAWLVARSDMPGRGFVRAIVTASFVTPPFLGAIAWEMLAAPNSGLINQFYRFLTGAEQYEYLVDIYTLSGVIFAISLYTFPYVFTLLVNALERVPADLEDASAMLGGGFNVTLRKITLPLVLPAMLAGMLIAVVQALTMFGTPAILALPAGFHVVTTKIWSLFQYPPKPGLAAASALPLLVITIFLLWAQSAILGRRGYTTLGGKSGDARLTKLGRWKPLGVGFVVLILMLTIVLPYLALLKTAVTKSLADPLTFSNMTWRHIHFVFVDFSATKLAMYNTFVLGFATATIGTLIALVVANLVTRKSVAGAPILGYLATAPVAIPGIVLGVGLFLAYSSPQFRLYGTLWILLIAFLTIEMPAGYQQLSSALKSVHTELEEAARVLGASRMRSLWDITAPLLSTNIVATWCFVFIGTIRELSATILLTTSDTKLVSVVIYDLHESGDLGAISVLGIMLLLVSFVVVTIAGRLNALAGRRTPQVR